ncbi:MAG: PD-(D/E)XK nuclease family protein [Caldilineaceae bacterium SB0662_bin_9]|uniref:PD-(D/E)XK nuclease family protein n=1 Tax=Caldilineaceae bacterium SB0662_bin_9 TaxID=2605258 RepID=A0A6B1DPP2_9CHLR|nr:PD-(D/E)XK nuclease family protein [Caldilineaceae bacterium SB0666_bin_21]MYD88736.1 PD-(D/E)XK nuclease family protein [Caldilineaceae bacterium SB0662_bin_9]
MEVEPFEFNQARLSAFRRCHRRFFLKYRSDRQLLERAFTLADRDWDAARLGQRFHLCMERLARGLPMQSVANGLPPEQAASLTKAWDYRCSLRADQFLTEYELTIPFDHWRLTARADLLARCGDGTVTIVDWKTGANTNTDRLRRSDQARILPYVVLEAARHLGWNTVTASGITLVFWFAQDPDNPLKLPYSQRQHEQSRSNLASIMGMIDGLEGEEAFARVPDDPATVDAVCRPCEYIHYCERNPTSAGPVQPIDYEEEDLESLWETFDFSLD